MNTNALFAGTNSGVQLKAYGHSKNGKATSIVWGKTYQAFLQEEFQITSPPHPIAIGLSRPQSPVRLSEGGLWHPFTNHDSLFTKDDSLFTKDDSLFTKDDSLFTKDDSLFTKDDSLFTPHNVKYS